MLVKEKLKHDGKRFQLQRLSQEKRLVSLR